LTEVLISASSLLRRNTPARECWQTDPLTILGIALGLAMDAFSVSIANGLATRNSKLGNALKFGGSFGFFQMLMPAIGWLGGIIAADLIFGVDHWIAFGLLCLVGCTMIYRSAGGGKTRKDGDHLSFHTLLILSIATSIDALAVGVGLAFLRATILIPVIVTGIITFLLSFIGVYIGNRVGRSLGSKVEVAGGLVLMIIGLKILSEHAI